MYQKFKENGAEPTASSQTDREAQEMKTKKTQSIKELLLISDLANREESQDRGNQEQRSVEPGVIDAQHDITPTINSVVNDADQIQFRLMDGREFEAKVKGADPQTDLAVTSIDDGQSTLAEPRCSWVANNDKKSWT
jgi:S1-C subfamily serine protease